ncbi:MAG: hypothetical protein RBU30_27205, partial [Polyangia bacterium]|nr:hypothetical protein [Polyangia bacterium]
MTSDSSNSADRSDSSNSADRSDSSNSSNSAERPDRTDASGTLFRQRCEFCGAVVNTLRRGRCWGCYQRWQESQPVGKGASCVVCGDRRLDNLQRVELFGRWLPLCHLCAVRSRHILPMPASVDGIRRALMRERRDGERRDEKPDTRLDPKDRRGPDRRAIPLDEGDLVFVGDLPSGELTDLALDLVFEPPVGEATRIYDKLNPSELVERTVRRVMPPPTPRLDLEPPREKVEVEVVEHLVKRRLRAGGQGSNGEVMDGEARDAQVKTGKG